jgi:hypothetical protein
MPIDAGSPSERGRRLGRAAQGQDRLPGSGRQWVIDDLDRLDLER